MSPTATDGKDAVMLNHLTLVHTISCPTATPHHGTTTSLSFESIPHAAITMHCTRQLRHIAWSQLTESNFVVSFVSEIIIKITHHSFSDLLGQKTGLTYKH